MPTYDFRVPKGLKRFYGDGDLHFITASCYRREPLLGTANRKDLFLKVLEQVRQRYQFVVVGYVVMPEHFHLLISEPERANPSVVIQALKLGVVRRLFLTPKAPEQRAVKLFDNFTLKHLAEALLRLQCVERAQASREAAVYTSQPDQTRTGGDSRSVEVEQLPSLCLWGNRTGCGE